MRRSNVSGYNRQHDGERFFQSEAELSESGEQDGHHLDEVIVKADDDQAAEGVIAHMNELLIAWE